LAGIYYAAWCRPELAESALLGGALALLAGGWALARAGSWSLARAETGSPEPDGGQPLRPRLRREPLPPDLQKRQRRAAALAAVLFLAGGFRFQAARHSSTELMDLAGREVLLTGRVQAVERRENGCRLLLRAEAVSMESAGASELGTGVGMGCDETVLIDCTGLPEHWDRLGGREITLWTKLELPVGLRNPGGFDYAAYLRGKEIRVLGSTQGDFVRETGRFRPLPGLPDLLRQRFGLWLEENTDRDTASLLTAMVLGDKSLLEDDLQAAFQNSGLSHLLAVSGLHVTILCLWLGKVAGSKGGRAGTLISLGALFFYGALCSFSPSVVRGITMIVLRKVGDLLHRRYDLLTGALAAAVATALWNPYRALQTGFLLSYGAVLSLALFLPPWMAWVEARRRVRQDLGMRLVLAAASALGASVVIFLGMAPVTALFFQQVAPASLLLNVPAMALAGTIMPLGFALFLFCACGGAGGSLEPAARLGVIAEELLLELLAALGKLGAGAPLKLEAPGAAFLILWYGGAFLLFSEWGRMMLGRRQTVKFAAAIACLLLLALVLPLFGPQGLGDAGLIFVDVGQGDCLHIRTPGGKDFLIDGGGSANSDVGKDLLLPYLLGNGITRLSGVLVTHLHDDHYKGLVTVCRELPVGGLVLYEGYRGRQQEVLEDTGLAAEKLTYVSAGDVIHLEEGIWMEILWPLAPAHSGTADFSAESADGSADENANSLVVKVHYLGVTVLMTADLGFEGEEGMLALCGQSAAAKTGSNVPGPDLFSHILKVGHHGSASSTGDAFLEAVSPLAAVIQVGAGNSYGHPAPSVLEKLQDSGIMVYRNDHSGAVLVTVTEKGFRVRTVR